MNIRFYITADYSQLAALYKQSTEFLFDEVTDSEEALERKIERDPESILIAEIDEVIVGSVCIIEDGRIALLFRLIADNNNTERENILSTLIEKACKILRARGYEQVHNTAPAHNEQSEQIRTQNGFTVGKDYTWYWKELSK